MRVFASGGVSGGQAYVGPTDGGFEIHRLWPSVPLAILQATARLLRRSCPMIAGLRRRCRSCERFAAGWRGVASRGRVYSRRLVGLLPGGVP